VLACTRAYAKNSAAKQISRVVAGRRTNAMQSAVRRMGQAYHWLRAVRAPGKIVNNVELRRGIGTCRQECENEQENTSHPASGCGGYMVKGQIGLWVKHPIFI